VTFDRAQLAASLTALAARNIYVGTSSWKYPGWLGQVYDRGRYEYRGRFAETRFERECLREYSETFKTVCVDGAYYRFPEMKYLNGMMSQVPGDFKFAFKVTDEITIKKFPNQPRHGERAGKPNENFLNADLFTRMFLGPCEEFRSRVGLLMFEFSHFWPGDFERGRDFVSALDTFLGALPKGWPYGVELRNRYWLKPAYFACLTRHEVTHVYNSWTDMPLVSEQMTVAGSQTHPELTAARFLLRPGRKYEDAVKTFQPYDQTKEVNPEARAAGAALIRAGANNPQRKTFVFVNNRLEGNAITTIKAMLDIAQEQAELPMVDKTAN
jgi:uncharacterized protein YecE (DUF72 family)